MTTYEARRDGTLADRSASFFLQDAIRKLDQRDPCDALNDVEALLELTRTRVDEACSIGGQYTARDEEDDEAPCTDPGGHKFECTGTQYGGDDERWYGEGRCLCIFCGADGDA